jgi:hypothetical protein
MQNGKTYFFDTRIPSKKSQLEFLYMKARFSRSYKGKINFPYVSMFVHDPNHISFAIKERATLLFICHKLEEYHMHVNISCSRYDIYIVIKLRTKI